MNRLEFLKELKESLIKTVQSACAPIIEDKMETWDRSIDVLSQLQWRQVATEIQHIKGIESKYVDGQSLILVHEDNTLRAYHGTCPSCGHLLHVFQMNGVCKCMNCDREYSLSSTDEGSLPACPIKKCEDGYYVGLNKGAVL